jgi:hypothetical protein
MNRTLFQISQSREDLSEYLYHFTSKRDAFDTLVKIIEVNALKDIRSKGVICFTEAPLTLLVKMFDIFATYDNPMYAPYGIAIKKSAIFDIGGRPVIYGTALEKNLLDQSIQWRFEEYHPTTRDFSWLREWRIQKDKIELNKDDCFIITKTKDELALEFDHDDIGEIEFDGCVADGQFHGYAYTTVPRRFKGVSLEEIREFNSLSKEQIASILASKNFSDETQIDLGGFSV